MAEATQKPASSTLLPTFSTQSLQLLLLTLAISAGAYARTCVGPLQETMRTALSLSDNQIALLQGPALALPIVLGAIPLGIVIDRHTRVRLLIILVALNFFGSLITAAASEFAVLVAARLLVGLAAFSVGPVAVSLLADLYAPAQRGRANTVMAVGQVGAAAAAFALGGALLGQLGTEANSWRWAMFWLACPLLPVALLALMLHEPRRTGVSKENRSAREALSELWRHRACTVPLITGLVMVGIADGAALIWAAPMLSRNFALSPERIGAILAMVLLGSGLLGPVVGGTLADRCQRKGGPRRTVYALVAMALTSVPAALFAVMPNASAAGVLLFVFITSGNAISVTALTLTTVVVPNELRGLCLAVMSAASVLFGLGLAPMTVSLLSGAIGGRATIGTALAMVGVATSFICAAIFAWGSRYFPRADRNDERLGQSV